jgi:hypothetical protein
LDLNNQRIRDGSEEVIINSAYSQISDDNLRDRLEAILSNVTLTDTLREIEDSNFAKFGPRSLAKPWEERKESLYAYFKNEDFDPGISLFRSNGRRIPVSMKAVSDNLIRASSAGLPYMMRKGIVLDDAFANYAHQVGDFPCVLFTRTQEERKTRDVWGFPISDTIREQQFFIPTLSYDKTQAHRAALLGPDAVDRAITLLLTSMKPGGQMFCVDFTSFDATVTPRHSSMAFSEIASLFQSGYVSEIYDIFRRFVTIPIYTPEGEISGPHGVPSGSTFTNTVGSLVQWILSGYHSKCQIQGDDGVYCVNSQSERDRIRDRFVLNGLIVNDSKSRTFNGQECVYLQRYYHPMYQSRDGIGLGGVYAAARAFLRIKYLESWTDFKRFGIEDADFFALRTIMILENCKHHPAFEDLVKLAHSLEKNNLKFSKQGLAAYSRVVDAKVRAGVFHSSNLEGINSFETVTRRTGQGRAICAAQPLNDTWS